MWPVEVAVGLSSEGERKRMCSKRDMFPFPLPRENLFLSLSGSVDCSVVIPFYGCSGGGWGWKQGDQVGEGGTTGIGGLLGGEWRPSAGPWTRLMENTLWRTYFIMQFERKGRDSYKNLQM